MKAKPGDLLAFAVLLAGAVLMVAPFLWMISTSLKPAAEQFDMRLIPATPSLANYPKIFELMPFHLLLWNSIKIAAISTFGQQICNIALAGTEPLVFQEIWSCPSAAALLPFAGTA